MPRLVMATDGNSERELCIRLPAVPWDGEPTLVTVQQSLAETFTELQEPVCRYLLALGLDASQAEEILQETFLRLCRHLKSGRPRDNLRGWVFRVAHNLAQDERRRRRRRPTEPLEQESMGASADAAATPEQRVIQRERATRLAAALDRLPARQRESLHLRAEGLRYREIAGVLGASISSVAEWVQQALKTLAKECHEE